MTINHIEQTFRDTVCAKIRLVGEGVDRYRVFTPFLFEDGDHPAMVLKRNQSSWELSDEGHTYMRLTYDQDEKELQRGARQRIIANALSVFGVQDRDGELDTEAPNDQYGDALFSFIQAIMKISNISLLSRERVRSRFKASFRAVMEGKVSAERLSFDWREPTHDPHGVYSVDCRINSVTRPLFVFALPNDARTRDATIALLQSEKWGVPHCSHGIFEDQETINRKVLARFIDVCEKQFSSLAGAGDRLARYFEDLPAGNA